MNRRSLTTTTSFILLVAVGAGVLSAQRNRSRRHGDLNARDYARYVPTWEVSEEVPNDVFTFARLSYSSGGYGWREKWATDYPDSDLNFSWRLQELTSLEVNPDPVVVALDDDALFDYPFVYMIEPGDIFLSQAEVENLRKYLLNGGFLMVDDFWGDWEWAEFDRQMKTVFPGREFVELELDHPVFDAVFDLDEKPQVPSIDTALRGRAYGVTYEWNKPGAEEVHYYALHDDDERVMCIVCFNTDLGDGWEREGENHWYFKEFAEKRAYPMGINIVFYAMTH